MKHGHPALQPWIAHREPAEASLQEKPCLIVVRIELLVFFYYKFSLVNLRGALMSLNKSYEKMKYDRRLLDLNLRLGQITKEEYDKFVNSLPDSADNSEKIDIEDTKKDSADFASH